MSCVNEQVELLMSASLNLLLDVPFCAGEIYIALRKLKNLLLNSIQMMTTGQKMDPQSLRLIQECRSLEDRLELQPLY